MRVLALALAVLSGTAALARAGTAAPVRPLNLSPDITTVMGETTVNDEEVVTDAGLSTVTPLNLGLPPPETDVIGHHQFPGGRQLFTFDTTVALPGGATARRGDVVVFDGTTYAIRFDAAAHGIPPGTMTDAVTTIAGGDLLLSFDTTVQLGDLTVDDEDLVRFDGTNFSLFFDGSAAGVPKEVDLDAAAYVDRTGHLLLSFDTNGRLQDDVFDIGFDDDDVLEYALETGIWTLLYDGSRQHGDPAFDVDAISLPLLCLLDVDGNGRVEVATDVVYVARRLLSLVPVPPSFRVTDPTIPSDETITANVDQIGQELDVDNNGVVEVATDVVYVARHLLTLVAVPPSFRTGHAEIPTDERIGIAGTGLCPVDTTPVSPGAR